MEIKIKRLSSVPLTGNLPGIVNTYSVIENGTEFNLTRTSHRLGSTVGIAGEKGILYSDPDDKIHHQITTPGGACGLITDDRIVDGLSSFTHHALITIDEFSLSGQITITVREDEKSS